ncbi:PAC2 family-domain-containing protein [Phlebopus sp. FC_14]|nr:PAC2 family-domain-containing protein [Phlebopus sp. FC_14]
MTFYRPVTNYTLTGKVLLVPVVSVANVAQLAADLFIASLDLGRVGVFDPKCLVPVVGACEHGAAGITTPLELFGSSSTDIAVIQQRSPVLKAFKKDFCHDLLEFTRTSGVSAVIFMAGVDMSNRHDAQMLTPTTYFCPPGSPSLASTPLASLAQLPIPPYSSPVPQFPPTDGEKSVVSVVPFIPGGGLARRILGSVPSSWQIPTLCLLQYVMEGDNRLDAQLLAVVVAKALNHSVSSWKQPPTWGYGLFGTPHDQTLYG